MSLLTKRDARATGLAALRKLALAASLTLLSLLVGAGCVLLPPMVPLSVIALAGLVYLWTIPDRRAVGDRFPRLTTYLFVVSILSIPSYYTLVFPGLPWLSLRRITLFIFLAATLFTFSTSPEHRSRLRANFRDHRLLGTALIVLPLLWVLSILGSAQPFATLNLILNQNFVWLIAMAAMILFVRTRQSAELFIRLVTACAVFDFAVGAVEFILRRPFLFYAIPAYMRAQLIQDNIYLSALITGGGIRNGLYRASSVYTVTLSWGEMAAMVAPLGIYIATSARTLAGRAYGYLVIASCFGSVYCSGSRGAMAGFIASSVVYAVLLAFRGARFRPHKLGGTIAVIAVCMGAVGTAGSIAFVDRVNKMVLGNGQTQSSTDSRNVQWALAKPYVEARPVLGYGVGEAARIVNYSPAAGANVSLDSYVITLLVEMGLPGLVAFMGILALIIITCAWRSLRDNSRESALLIPISCALTSYTLYRLTLSQIDNNYFAFMLIGLAVSILNMSTMPSVPGRILNRK